MPISLHTIEIMKDLHKCLIPGHAMPSEMGLGFQDVEPLPICLGDLVDNPVLDEEMLALGDEEGLHIPEDLPPVVDAHVHLFPDRLFDAVFQWFEKFGWPIRYPLRSRQVMDFLFDRGISHIIGLCYAHKAGMAAGLNQYMAGLNAQEKRLTGLATVFPGEDGAADLLEAAFESGLHGVKLHCHVQCFSVDSPAMAEIYEVCIAHDKPMLIHAGREPRSSAYKADPALLCSADRVESVLKSFPQLRLCVPHLGSDEYDAYHALVLKYENLYLDTTVALAGYLSKDVPWKLLDLPEERLLYGSDFPILPYAWDRELKRILERGLSARRLERLLGLNAKALFAVG